MFYIKLYIAPTVKTRVHDDITFTRQNNIFVLACLHQQKYLSYTSPFYYSTMYRLSEITTQPSIIIVDKCFINLLSLSSHTKMAYFNKQIITCCYFPQVLLLAGWFFPGYNNISLFCFKKYITCFHFFCLSCSYSSGVKMFLIVISLTRE